MKVYKIYKDENNNYYLKRGSELVPDNFEFVIDILSTKEKAEEFFSIYINGGENEEK